jgi:hypothetical protein
MSFRRTGGLAVNSTILLTWHSAFLAMTGAACYGNGMNNERPSPYSLEISTCERPQSHYQWAIRKHGKLIQRSDRSHPSEDKARANALVELDRLSFGDWKKR